MDLTPGVVLAAIKKLIRLKRRNKQYGGIVFDENLNMICFDPHRVPEDQLDYYIKKGRAKFLGEMDMENSVGR